MSECIKGAVISECDAYRYVIWRRWNTRPGYVLFICLNPSTADAHKDDKTMKRCINFAKDWGYGAVYVVNLFAYRATRRKDMLEQEAPIGIDNDKTILQYAKGADKIVCGWGTDGTHMLRNNAVYNLLSNYKLYCLEFTKDKHPKHPLYIKGDTKLKRYKPSLHKL